MAVITFFIFCFLIAKVHIKKIKSWKQLYEIYCKVVNFQTYIGPTYNQQQFDLVYINLNLYLINEGMQSLFLWNLAMDS